MTPAAGEDAMDWRRLSSLTLLLAVVRLGPGTVRMIPALAAIGIAASWVYVVPALLAFMALSLGFAWLAWARFRWRIGGDAIIIESGILDRQHRTIPFDRIQDVSIEQGLVARALDLAKVGFETGASAEGGMGDGGLDSISLVDAEALRTTIRAWRSGIAPTLAASDAATGVPDDDDAELFTLSPQRLILAGLFNFSLAALAVTFAVSQYVDDFLPFDLFDPRAWMDMVRQSGVDGWIEAHRWVAGLGAAGVLLFVGFATGVVRTVLTNWNFRLTLGPRAFRRVRGLTTRTDVAIPIARVQAAIVATGLIRRFWGWHELRLQSLASDGKEEKDHQLVPFGQLTDIDAVMQPAGITRPGADVQWQYPPLIVQALPGFIAAGLAVAGAVGGYVFGQPFWPIPLLVAGWLIGISIMTARRHRWAETADTLFVWRGWWNPRLTILPFANVQSADLADGPILRRYGVVRLVLGVPGESAMASHEIDAVPAGAAAGLRARILMARTRRS